MKYGPIAYLNYRAVLTDAVIGQRIGYRREWIVTRILPRLDDKPGSRVRLESVIGSTDA